jgi:uncharacterized BrkB/YihY/UPF0761 family membrane protein
MRGPLGRTRNRNMMEIPTTVLLYVYLYVALAAGIGLALAIKAVRRAVVDSERRRAILGVGIISLALWVAASFAMGFMTFVTGFGIAHLRPAAVGPFPEGWQVYALLGLYAALGTGLMITIGRVPSKRAAA